MKLAAIGAIFLTLTLALANACRITANKPDNRAKAVNIILFIGDGMGRIHRQAARLSAGGESGKLAMDGMAVTGWAHTRSASNPVTDSAAAATAMACGTKTNNGVVGMNASGQRLPSILEEAKGMGKSTGLVSSGQLTNATPAAFAAHVHNRYKLAEIAAQMSASQVDVLLGGGENDFLPTFETGCYPEPGKRTDGRNLIREAVAAGYAYACKPSVLFQAGPAAAGRQLGLFADEGLTWPRSPSLAALTQKAIDLLSRNANGFFLMVEEDQIDEAAHDHDAALAIACILKLDEAVRLALDFAKADGETLVIVAADHETGGLRIFLNATGEPGEQGPFPMPDGKVFYASWSTDEHTADDVPVTSLGPSSTALNGSYENTFIHDVMRRAFFESR